MTKQINLDALLEKCSTEEGKAHVLMRVFKKRLTDDPEHARTVIDVLDLHALWDIRGRISSLASSAEKAGYIKRAVQFYRLFTRRDFFSEEDVGADYIDREFERMVNLAKGIGDNKAAIQIYDNGEMYVEAIGLAVAEKDQARADGIFDKVVGILNKNELYRAGERKFEYIGDCAKAKGDELTAKEYYERAIVEYMENKKFEAAGRCAKGKLNDNIRANLFFEKAVARHDEIGARDSWHRPESIRLIHKTKGFDAAVEHAKSLDRLEVVGWLYEQRGQEGDAETAKRFYKRAIGPLEQEGWYMDAEELARKVGDKKAQIRILDKSAKRERTSGHGSGAVFLFRKSELTGSDMDLRLAISAFEEGKKYAADGNLCYEK